MTEKTLLVKKKLYYTPLKSNILRFRSGIVSDLFCACNGTRWQDFTSIVFTGQSQVHMAMG